MFFRRAVSKDIVESLVNVSAHFYTFSILIDPILDPDAPLFHATDVLFQTFFFFSPSMFSSSTFTYSLTLTLYLFAHHKPRGNQLRNKIKATQYIIEYTKCNELQPGYIDSLTIAFTNISFVPRLISSFRTREEKCLVTLGGSNH